MDIPAALQSKHFLVVDDYESMRVMVSDQLKALGVQKISYASSGNEALAKSTLRMSLGQYSTIEGVNDLLNILAVRLARWHG